MIKNRLIKGFEHHELNRARLIFGLAAVLQPIWYFATIHMLPNQVDSLNWRYFISLVFATYSVFLPRLPLKQKSREIYLAPAGVLITAHALTLSWLNDWHTHYAIFTIAVIATTFSLISTRLGSWLYTFTILATVAFCQYHWGSHFGLPLITLWALTIVAVGLLSNFDRSRALDELMRSELSSQTIVQNMTEGLIVRDRTHATVFANAATVNILGDAIEEIYAQESSIDKLVGYAPDGHEMSAEEWPSKIAVTTKRPVQNFPMEIKRSDGKMISLLVTAVPALDENTGEVERVVITFQDVSKIRQAEKELADNQSVLLHSAKLTALSEMAGGIAHEINTPLTTIATNAEIIENRLQQTPLNIAGIKASTDRIRKTVDRIAKIIKSMRALSAAEVDSRPELVHISEVIETFLDIGQSRPAQSDVDLKIEQPVDFELECRSAQISQVMISLINNAYDALKGLEQPKKWIRVEAHKYKTFAEISVHDSGPGIKPEVLEKIWQPFFTTKPVGQGQGIGLSISRKVAEAHGGALVYEPIANNTRFVLRLPLKQPDTVSTDAIFKKDVA